MDTQQKQEVLVDVLEAVETTDQMDLVVFNDDVNTFHTLKITGCGRQCPPHRWLPGKGAEIQNCQTSPHIFPCSE